MPLSCQHCQFCTTSVQYIYGEKCMYRKNLFNWAGNYVVNGKINVVLINFIIITPLNLGWCRKKNVTSHVNSAKLRESSHNYLIMDHKKMWCVTLQCAIPDMCAFSDAVATLAWVFDKPLPCLSTNIQMEWFKAVEGSALIKSYGNIINTQ
jgi:hypothetical protein